MSGGVVLSLRALGLGDLLTGVPALRALRRAFPDSEHLLATPAVLAPLALHSGAVDAVVPAAPLEPVALPDGRHIDVAVNLHGRGPESHEVLRALRPGRMVAFASGDVAGPRWEPAEHEVTRWCRLLRESGIAADEGDLGLAPPDRDAPPAALGATLLHPFPSRPARRWPADRWVALARAELGAGRAVVITGDASQRREALAIAAAAGLPDAAVLAGRLDVLDLAATVAAAGRVVAVDTGVAHLATAMGTPSVVLFGPVPPSEWGPPADRPWHRALWAGRRGDPASPTSDPGLLAIGVTDVLAALAGLPDGPDRPLGLDRSSTAGRPSGPDRPDRHERSDRPGRTPKEAA